MSNTVSKHFTKASAQTAASKAEVQPPKRLNAHVRYIVVPTGKRLRRWKVVAV